MRSIRHPNIRIYPVTALCLLLLLGMLYGKNVADTVRGRNASIARQILNRSAPICAALAPARQDVTISVDYVALRSQDQWSVSCTDSIGREIASLQWDGANGRLLSAGAPPPARSEGGNVLFAPDQAIVSARRWLGLLGFSNDHGLSDLHCTREPKQWIVVCRFEDRDVVLHFDVHTGLLSFAAITPKGPK
jgi:hypothetical protein